MTKRQYTRPALCLVSLYTEPHCQMHTGSIPADLNGSLDGGEGTNQQDGPNNGLWQSDED